MTIMEITPAQWWAIAAVVLLIAEIASTSFVFVFFSAGAFVAALTTWLGLTPELSGQLLVFSGVSLLTLALFRRKARQWFHRPGRSRDYVEFTGDEATVTSPIPAGGEGRVAYRGSEWTARTDTGQAVAAGQTVIIRRTEGIRVIVSVNTNQPVQPVDR